LALSFCLADKVPRCMVRNRRHGGAFVESKNIICHNYECDVVSRAIQKSCQRIDANEIRFLAQIFQKKSEDPKRHQLRNYIRQVRFLAVGIKHANINIDSVVPAT
jgi:t-SNARE complex subunit (syntaxin)